MSNYSTLFSTAEKAYSAGQYKLAAGIFAQCVELAESDGNIRGQITALFWQGDCLGQMGDIEAGFPLLLQAVATTDPAIDPADRYNALAKLAEIVLEQKSRKTFKKILLDSHNMLAEINRPEWAHKLLLLEGQLYLGCGDYEHALPLLKKALAAKKAYPDYPGYTHHTHLFDLARAGFLLGDSSLLRQLAEEAGKTETVDEAGNNYTTLIALWADRLEFCGQALPRISRDRAREVLDRQRAFDDITNTNSHQALRALALYGDFTSVDFYLDNIVLNNDRFSERLAEGDLSLMCARNVLALPVVDDEIAADSDLPDRITNGDTEKGREFLNTAINIYENMRQLATKEDQRLETSHHLDTLSERINRAKAILAAL